MDHASEPRGLIAGDDATMIIRTWSGTFNDKLFTETTY